MLTLRNYSNIQNIVTTNLWQYLPMQIEFKSRIQVDVQLTPSETLDLIACTLNKNVVKKLARLGREHYLASDKSDTTLYCICMAIGTIVKEYDWGTYYISPSGMCELADMIVG